MSTTVTVSQSCEVPIKHGTINVDTTHGGVTLFITPASTRGREQTLTITKITNDKNPVSIMGDNTTVDDADIIIFGLPKYAKVARGKNKTIVLQSIDSDWKIISEY